MIESLRLEGFKNFRDATLRLGPFTVIVGTNASGKSNLRDAFRFLHGMSRGYSLAEIIGEKYVEGGVLQWKGIRGGLREVAFDNGRQFRLTTSLNAASFLSRRGNSLTLRHSIDVEVATDAAGPHVARESFYDRDRLIFASHDTDDPPEQEPSHYIRVRLPRDERNRKRGMQPRFLDTKPIVSQMSNYGGLPPVYQSTAFAFCESLESMRFLDLSPDAMRVPSFPGQLILGDRGENLSSVLYAICQDADAKRALADWIRQLTPLDVIDFEFIPDQTGKILVNLVESGGRRTSAYSASDGTLRFLAIIAALLGPDSAKFYFLEELDNGIHPTRLSLLLQLIEQQAREGKVQVVATTHSPQLLAMLGEDSREHASLVYRPEGSGEGRICRIVDLPEARRVLEDQSLARLHESGWLEDAVAFAATTESAP